MLFYNNYTSSNNSCNHFSHGEFYSLFLGLDDKCECVQLIPTQEAVEFVEDICKQYFTNGFTILVGSGANRGNPTGIETSIYITAINATKESVFQVAAILREEFNITEVLIEKNETQYLYFSK